MGPRSMTPIHFLSSHLVSYLCCCRSQCLMLDLLNDLRQKSPSKPKSTELHGWEVNAQHFRGRSLRHTHWTLFSVSDVGLLNKIPTYLETTILKLTWWLGFSLSMILLSRQKGGQCGFSYMCSSNPLHTCMYELVYLCHLKILKLFAAEENPWIPIWP